MYHSSFWLATPNYALGQRKCDTACPAQSPRYYSYSFASPSNNGEEFVYTGIALVVS